MALEKFTKEGYYEANNLVMNMTEYMDLKDRENGENVNDGLDSLERRLKENNLSLVNNTATGATVGTFMKTEELQMMFPEVTRRLLVVAAEQFPIRNLLLAGTQYVNSDVVKTLTVEANNKDNAMARVAEGAELPRIKIKSKDEALILPKYGRAVEASYETVQKMGMTMFRSLIGSIKNATLIEKTISIVSALLKGQTAETVANLTIDSLVEVLGANVEKVGFFDTVIVNKGGFKLLSELLYPVAGKDLQPIMKSLYGSVNFEVGNTTKTLNILYRPELEDIIKKASGENGLILVRKDQGAYEYIQTNSNFEEYAKFIEKQTEILTVSERVGYDVFNKDAVKVIKATK